jgi:hypothetical protein
MTTRPALHDPRASKKDNAMPKLKPSDQVTSLRKLQADLMAKLKEAQVEARLETKEIQRLKNEIAGSVALKELDANPTGSFASALTVAENALK